VSSLIPMVVNFMLETLFEKGATTQEGIFRLSGRITEVYEIKEAFNSGKYSDYSFLMSYDIHSVAVALKLFFRELESPLLNFMFQAI